MDEKFVLLSEYPIDRDLIDQISEEGREIKEQDIENDLQRILKDNNIIYKVKIDEHWSGRKMPKYDLIARIYVQKEDLSKAQNLLSPFVLTSTPSSNKSKKDSKKKETANDELETMKRDHERKVHLMSLFLFGFPIAVLVFFIIYFLIENIIYYIF